MRSGTQQPVTAKRHGCGTRLAGRRADFRDITDVMLAIRIPPPAQHCSVATAALSLDFAARLTPGGAEQPADEGDW